MERERPRPRPRPQINLNLTWVVGVATAAGLGGYGCGPLEEPDSERIVEISRGHGVYVAGEQGARDWRRQAELGVRAVLVAARDYECDHRVRGLECLHLDLVDDGSPEAVAKMEANFDASVQFITTHRAHGGVLVHCRGGVSRSPTVCAEYLRVALGEDPERSLERMAGLRPAIMPDDGFRELLRRRYNAGASASATARRPVGASHMHV
jgi:predicted protein tyrosine phosphatase